MLDDQGDARHQLELGHQRQASVDLDRARGDAKQTNQPVLS
jgi:hypothetical protein